MFCVVSSSHGDGANIMKNEQEESEFFVAHIERDWREWSAKT